MQETYKGASVIQYTLKPSRGLKMSSFEKHDKDLALVLKAKSIRIQAPIMGTDLVGVEVPNPKRAVIKLPDEIERIVETPGTLTIPIGVDVYGRIITKDLADMPHLLIAGATGSGKSVMINVVIRSLVEQNTPEALKLVLIDPKRVELSQFKNLPNLLAPVIYDEKKATTTLNWLVEEMEIRYDRLEKAGYRGITDYNANNANKMSKIVVVIDEFADLILQSDGNETEKAVIRLAQKARAIGIHIVLGTQRPSVDVVTGLIKANFPTRIAFMTSSRMDSQVILDQAGAEELIGKGDMLFLDPTVRGLQRLQGFYA
jgi:S-DNA-T family DNA segregation ATPase FtsK/SpoIIIE